MEQKYFSEKALGGMIASRVDSQDSVAATIALDLIRGELKPLDPPSTSQPIEFFCEGQEDLEIVQSSKKILVSVKDKLIRPADIKEEIKRKLEPALEGDLSRTIYLRVSCLRGLESRARTLDSDIEHLRERLESKSGGGEAAVEFQKKWDIDPGVAAKVWIDDRNLGRETPSSEALFAHTFRLTFPTTTLTDRAISELGVFLADQIFAPARRNRKRIDLLEVENKLLERVSPLELRYLLAEVQATPFGYVPSNDRRDKQQELQLVQRVANRAMRSWRQKTFIERILIPPVNCMRCNHPMMANFRGRNGYACPDCGFMPFGSLLYACDCGTPVLIENNPQISGTEFLTYATRRTRNEDFKCDKCDEVVDPRKIVSRLFFVPIPWPVPKNIDSILVAKRIALGWGKELLTAEEAESRMLSGSVDWELHLPEAEKLSRRDRIFWAIERLLVLVVIGFVVFNIGSF